MSLVEPPGDREIHFEPETEPVPVPTSWLHAGHDEAVEPHETRVIAVETRAGTERIARVDEYGEPIEPVSDPTPAIRVLYTTPDGRQAVERAYPPDTTRNGWRPPRREFRASYGVPPGRLDPVQGGDRSRYRELARRHLDVDTVPPTGGSHTGP